jgi:FRG domain
MNLLRNITIRNAELITDWHGQEVLHVQDPHALIQASGYLKFTRANQGEAIFFRGQSQTYPSLTPTLFRSIGGTQSAQSARVRDRNEFMADIVARSPILSTFGDYAHEPLLQHYGVSTTWIDLVDNIWVALWFSCYKAHVSGDKSQYLHFERRDAATSNDEFAYILLIGADYTQTGAPGLFKGPNTELVDLRLACPSIFLRPHAQHGVLFRKRGQGVMRPVDYSGQVRGVIGIRLSDALAWLGDAKTLSVHALFPPPYYDFGYRILLDGRFENKTKVGSIFIVGA